MSPPGIKPKQQPVVQRVLQLGRFSRTQALTWKIDGRSSTRRYPFRKIKFANWKTDEQIKQEDDEDYEQIAPSPVTPKRGDWAILLTKDGDQDFDLNNTHLVPTRLLDYEGAVFCYDDSVAQGDKWVQVLPVDAKGKVIARAVAACNLSQSIEGEHGDVIAIQTVPSTLPDTRPDSSKTSIQEDLTEAENEEFWPDNSDDWKKVKLPDLGVKDIGIVVTQIRGRCSQHWSPRIDAFAASDEDSEDSEESSDTDSEDTSTLNTLYAKFHLADPNSLSPGERSKQAIDQFKGGIPLMQEAAGGQPGPDIADRAKQWAGGVVQFMEDGAPSPTAGPTTPLSFAAWVSQMSETPPPPGGWQNTPADYQAPDTPVSDGFGLVSSPLDMACLLVAVGKSVKNLVDIADDKTLSESERNKRIVSELCNLGTYMGHMGVAGIGIADIAYGAWVTAEKAKTATEQAQAAIERAAEQTSGHLTIAASVIGVVVGTYVTVRHSRKAESARRRMNKVNKLRKEKENEIAFTGTGGQASERAMLEHLTFAEHKLRRKKFKSAFTATSAALGAAGSTGTLVVAAIGTTAAANAWNPVGWTIFAVGLGVGLGITGYVLWRRFKREDRYEKRETQGRPVNAHAYARALAEAYLDPEFKSKQPNSWDFVKRQLKAIGIKSKKRVVGNKPPTPAQMAKLVSLIERKVSSS